MLEPLTLSNALGAFYPERDGPRLRDWALLKGGSFLPRHPPRTHDSCPEPQVHGSAGLSDGRTCRTCSFSPWFLLGPCTWKRKLAGVAPVWTADRVSLVLCPIKYPSRSFIQRLQTKKTCRWRLWVSSSPTGWDPDSHLFFLISFPRNRHGVDARWES